MAYRNSMAHPLHLDSLSYHCIFGFVECTERHFHTWICQMNMLLYCKKSKGLLLQRWLAFFKRIYLNVIYLQHLSSSDPSWQSFSPSQRQLFLMQFPSLQLNICSAQTWGGRVICASQSCFSSEPSEQSSSPSHLQRLGIHMWLGQVNWLLLQVKLAVGKKL